MTPSPKLRPRGILATVSFVGVVLLLAADVHAGKPAIRIISDAKGRPTSFEATGISKAQLATLSAVDLSEGSGLRLLSLHVAEAGKAVDSQPILGTYEVRDSALRFTPRFSLRTGLNYHVVFRPDAKLVKSDTIEQANLCRQEYRGQVVDLDVAIPNEANAKPTEITQVYPSGSVLPENQLKFYLHFSAPMSRNEAYQHIELLKADGTPVDLPFLELGEELWDGSGKRLTVLFDPGRIKRGVKPREDLGPALEDGHEYTLVIHSDWNDVAGNPLAKSFRKTFRAGPPVATALDTATWKVSAPRADSKAPLAVTFPRPLDHALLERTFSVVNPKGLDVRGRVTIRDTERRWVFQPEQPWSAGAYTIVVDTVLEDLAGNRIGRPFEVDQTGPIEKRLEVETVSIPFHIGH